MSEVTDVSASPASTLADDAKCGCSCVASLCVGKLAEFPTNDLAMVPVALLTFISIRLAAHTDFDEEPANLSIADDVSSFIAGERKSANAGVGDEDALCMRHTVKLLNYSAWRPHRTGGVGRKKKSLGQGYQRVQTG